MPLVTKTTGKWGFQAKPEATYGTAVALTPATDGIRLSSAPSCKVTDAYDGKRDGKSPGSYAMLPLVGSEGRTAECDIVMEAAGAGAAYSASVLPNAHKILICNGWKAVVDTTSGSESVTYTPGDDADFLSICAEAYEYGELYAIQGILGEGIELDCTLPKIASLKSKLKGIMAAFESDAAIPSDLVYNSTIGPKATAMNLTLADFAPVRVQEFKLTQKTGLTDRFYDNVNARHGGYFFGEEVDFAFECTIELPPLATGSPFHTGTTFNPRALKELGTSFAVALQVGGTQYKQFNLAAPAAQIVDDPREKKGAIATLKLSLAFRPTTEVVHDEVTLVYN